MGKLKQLYDDYLFNQEIDDMIDDEFHYERLNKNKIKNKTIMANGKGAGRSKKEDSLEKKLINDLENVFKVNTDNEPQEEEQENEMVVVGVNEIFNLDYDKNEQVVVALCDALVDGHGEDTSILLLLSAKQIAQLYHFHQMEIHKLEWEKTHR
jgi:hypothetical protein